MANIFRRVFGSTVEAAFEAFWGAVGGALWGWLGAAVLAAVVSLAGVIASYSLRLPSIWFTRATAALITSIFIALIGLALSSFRRRQVGSFASRLWEVAQSDSRNMWPRIHAYWGAVVTDPHLDAVNPYIDLTVQFVNATVFDLRADHVEGRINYNTDPLRDIPEIFEQNSGNHGAWFHVTLRQWLLPETAQRMSKEIPLTLKTGHLALFFRYTDERGDTQMLRYAFPDEIFKITPAQAPVDSVTTHLEIQGLYVGRIVVDVQHLAQDYYLKIRIIGFNGTGATLTFTGLDGYVRYREYAQDQAVDRGQLPTPVFDANSSYNLNPTNWSEFWIDFEQRVPNDLAASMSAALTEERSVQLDLSALNIGISLLNQTGDKARLPVWDGVLVQQLEDKVFVGKVINVSVAATVKVTG